MMPLSTHDCRWLADIKKPAMAGQTRIFVSPDQADEGTYIVGRL